MSPRFVLTDDRNSPASLWDREARTNSPIGWVKSPSPAFTKEGVGTPILKKKRQLGALDNKQSGDLFNRKNWLKVWVCGLPSRKIDEHIIAFPTFLETNQPISFPQVYQALYDQKFRVKLPYDFSAIQPKLWTLSIQHIMKTEKTALQKAEICWLLQVETTYFSHRKGTIQWSSSSSHVQAEPLQLLFTISACVHAHPWQCVANCKRPANKAGSTAEIAELFSFTLYLWGVLTFTDTDISVDASEIPNNQKGCKQKKL